MLLTSSQVSVAISSSVVFLFTTALFLSGYAVQQKTVRDLRVAVRPKPRPTDLFYLPQQFKTEPDPAPDVSNNIGGDDGSGGDFGEDLDTVEVRVSTPESPNEQAEVVGASRRRKPTKNRHSAEELPTPEDPASGSQKVIGVEEIPSELVDAVPEPHKVKQDPTPLPEAVPPEKTLSRAERRKKIKEELMKGSEEGTMGGSYRPRMW